MPNLGAASYHATLWAFLALLLLTGCQGGPVSSGTSPSASPEAKVPVVAKTPPVTSNPSPSPTDQVCCGGEGGEEPSSAPTLVRKKLPLIDQGDVITTEFKITNTGDSVAEMSGEPSFSYPCCVKISVEPESIPPGKQATMTVTLDSKWRSRQTDIFINLPYEGGQVPKAFLVEAVVRPSFTVRPNGVEMKEAKGDYTFTVGGEDLFSGFKVLDIESSDPRLKVEEKERTPKTIVYRVLWTDDGPGDALVKLKVKTDHPKVPEFPVVVAPPGIDRQGRPRARKGS